MKEWLVVDGYNVINSWQDFRKFREENLEHARELLKEKLAEYIAFKGYSGSTGSCIIRKKRSFGDCFHE